MVQIDYSLKKQFSWSEYCESSKKNVEAWEDLSASSKDFLQRLNLPSQHPNCITGNFFDSDAPLMGPLLKHDYHDGLLETITTSLIQASPTSIAMGELWLRLFAGFLSPVGIAYLVMCILSPKVHTQPPRKTTTIESNLHFRITCASLIALASSLILATDMWYIYQFGPHYGISLFAFASTLSMALIHRYNLTYNLLILFIMWGLAFSLTYRNGSFNFGGDELPYNVSEGLYYDHKNILIRQLVEEWPKENRTYSLEYGATPWTVTGDTRTGIPFLINDAFPLPPLNVVSVWVPTVDDEAVRLDIVFPPKSNNQSLEGKSIHVILHGLSGGSQEEYVKDYVLRATARGHTVAIMIARGLMDTPIKGWNVFHGARVDDINVTAKALRNALLPGQSLIGIGYSMGAIILTNYVARSGKACSLDAAIALSGVLDARYQYFNERAKRVWQPMLAITLRDQFVMGKLANKYQERLTRKQMVSLMRATHITGVDEFGVVAYNGFRDVLHYYSEMSAMGDIPLDSPAHPGRIANVSIPLCILSALDDPLITWKAVAANDGMRHPSNLVQTGTGNLIMLLTKAGGHVGWPLGMNPGLEKWRWMNGAVQTFADAFEKVKEHK